MKKILLVLGVLLPFLLSSCVTTFDRELLQATKTEVNPKLINLELDDIYSTSVNDSSLKSLTQNSYFYTIFEREYDENLIEWDENIPQLGTIKLVLIDVSHQPVSTFTLTTKVYVEFEIRIYDSDGKKIWNHSYFKEGDPIIIWTNSQGKSEVQTKEILIFKELIENAKLDLSKDANEINKKLQTNYND